MSQDYLTRIAALEDALRQKDNQLSLVAETESLLSSALARAEEKIENEEREIEHLRVQIEKLRRMLSVPAQKNFANRLKKPKPCLNSRSNKAITTTDGKTIHWYLASCASPVIVARYRNTFPVRYTGWSERKPAARNAATVWSTSSSAAIMVASVEPCCMA